MTARARRMAFLVAALGYFVDIYDLFLFSIVRIRSLESIGVGADAILRDGLILLNMQMGGMLVGGIFWGVLGDKKGRLSVLFGSILLYSLANVANGFVQDVGTYAALRFIAGVGLAGELGAGITLVSEIMKRETRGYGTTVIASIGICGAIAAALVAKVFDWRTCYFIGGGLGLTLLVLRVSVLESGLFERAKQQTVARGDFLGLFRNAGRARRYVAVILLGVPIWYVMGITITLAPELAKAMGMTVLPSAGDAVMCAFAGQVVGDLCSGTLSQVLRTRRRALLVFLTLTTLFVGLYFTLAARSLPAFYLVCGGLGFSTGYWAVFITVASEQFGTNIRATVTTTTPNFVRGSVIPMTWLFEWGRPHLGVIGSAIAVAALVFAVAFVSLGSIEETFGKDLDFLET